MSDVEKTTSDIIPDFANTCKTVAYKQFSGHSNSLRIRDLQIPRYPPILFGFAAAFSPSHASSMMCMSRCGNGIEIPFALNAL